MQWEARGETVKALAEAARATKAATSDLSMMVQYKSKGVGLLVQSTPSLKEKVMEVFVSAYFVERMRWPWPHRGSRQYYVRTTRSTDTGSSLLLPIGTLELRR